MANRLSVSVVGADRLARATSEAAAGLEAGRPGLEAKLAYLVAEAARPKVPTMSGRARSSVRATGSTVSGGGGRVKYFGWLDFGGRVGRKGSVRRPYVSEGRYIFPSYRANRDKITKILVEVADDALKGAGL